MVLNLIKLDIHLEVNPLLFKYYGTSAKFEINVEVDALKISVANKREDF